MPVTLRALLVVALVALGLIVLDRFALWLERRGWLYYRKRKGSGARVGNALVGVQSIFEPDKRHVVEQRTLQREARQAEAEGGPGDGPKTKT